MYDESPHGRPAEQPTDPRPQTGGHGHPGTAEQRGDPGGAPRTEPAGPHQPAGAQAGQPPRERPADTDVTTPTLRWFSISQPGEAVPLGDEDYVLESVFDWQRGAWEVLVLLQPTEPEED